MPTTLIGSRPVLTKLAVAAWCEVVEPSTSALIKGRYHTMAMSRAIALSTNVTGSR